MASDPDTFRVSPSLQNMPGVNAPAVESAGPAMMVRAGQGITRAAGVAAEVYQREVREQNATRVTEALTQLTQFQHELTYGVDGDDSGWVSQQGKNALERPDGLPLDEDVGRRFRERMESLS